MAQTIVFSTLVLALILFAWGKIRHDIVAIICLLVLVFTQVVPANEAFMGFAHPAVITVAVILIVSNGLQKSGLVDVIGHWVMKLGDSLVLQIAVLSTIVCVASAFMNNVGALAVLMPVAIHIANKSKHSPSYILMPIAFASLLGGMTTLIGTPPNIIVAAFREEALGTPFQMFDFAYVGVGLSVAGLAFISIIGWRLLPERGSKEQDKGQFNIEDYITEIEITEESKLNRHSLSEIGGLTECDVQVLRIVRDNHLIHAPDMSMVLRPGDIVTIEADSEELKTFVEKSKGRLVGKGESSDDETIGGEHITTVEVVVMANAPIFNQTAAGLRMRSRYGVNLLAISRQGSRIRRRLDHVIFRAGDVLLLQGDANKIHDTLNDMGCLPLADRGYIIEKPQKIVLALSIFALALFLIITNVTQVQIAFTLAALLMVLTKVISVREIYTSVDWPVVVLLGALLPVGTALETTGGSNLIAAQILRLGDQIPVWGMIAVLLMVTMFLSDIINNAATVVLMAPVSVSVANGLGASVDPFLMTVALGASCAFLTPIGHQSNTLVMGPGGYKFTDYWRMGLPLEILILLFGVPLILHFWPA
ncbi:MAG: SLC13 family permease [Saprospiraceae bacterium]|nr:SLC13 family permease [Saprospiraceae bacterium]